MNFDLSSEDAAERCCGVGSLRKGLIFKDRSEMRAPPGEGAALHRSHISAAHTACGIGDSGVILNRTSTAQTTTAIRSRSMYGLPSAWIESEPRPSTGPTSTKSTWSSMW